ncbi:O-antigen ligase family protein [Flavobacterium sp. N1736]|uniref:O-antigen ligase family protein n=1 Tax=Flavobacterium sp. N1736 TaxID=2986823 RepID=UPI002224161C|nr:O-antigen ligase family protein [Flavobacterium sp. N1736]
MYNIRASTNSEISLIPNFIVLLFTGLILVVDFLPHKGMTTINPQFLYLSLLNLVFGIYVCFNLKLISKDLVPILKKSYIFRSYLVFLFISLLSIIVAGNTSLFFTKITQLLIVFCLFINLCILLKDKIDLLYKIIIIISIGAFFQSWQVFNEFMQTYKASIDSALIRMTGNAGNVNILAASLTIKIPFLLLGITHFTNYKKLLLLITLLLVTTVIFLTGARTALLSTILIFLIYIFSYLKINSFSKAYLLKVSILILPLLISIFISTNMFKKTTNSRYVSIDNKLQQINTEDASSQARLRYWGNAIKLSKQNPFLGVGLGNYLIESIPYEATTENDSIVSLNTHNDFLEITAETGIVNGFVFLSLFVFVFFVNAKKIIYSTDPDVRTVAMLTLMLVVVYGMDSLFNFPLYRPTMQIFLSLLLSLTVINKLVLDDFKLLKNHKIKLYPILLLVTIITTYSAYLINKASTLEDLIKKDDINHQTKGALTGDEVISRLPLYPNVFNTSEAYYEYAGIYYLREKNYEKAYVCFSKASKINPYTGRINYYKHLISKEKNNVDSAYVYIKEAFYLRPRDLFYYQHSTSLAAVKKDTTEILKEYKLFSKYRKIAETWSIPATELQKAKYNEKSLNSFIDHGLKEMPNDSTLKKLKSNLLVKKYTLDGQVLLSQSKFNESLESFKEALKIDPKDAYLLQSIGLNYYYSKNYIQALTYFLDAVKYPGLNNGLAEYYIGICYLKNNDQKNACKYFNLSKAKNFGGAQQQLIKECK